MTFTVTYRGADGALREEAVEAASRAECFAQCKARGIAPVGVREGAQKGGRKNAASPKMAIQGGAGRAANVSAAPRGGTWATQGGAGRAANVSAAPRGGTWKAAILAAAVLAAAGGAWWWLAGRDAPDKAKAALEANKTVKGIKAIKDAKGTRDAKDAKAAKGSKDANAVADAAPSIRVADGPGVPALPDAPTNTPSIPPLPPPTFSNASDQVLAMIASADASGALPPLPISRDIEAEFLASLKQEIVILDSDDEKTRALKQSVKETREELKRLVDGGMTVAQVLAEHQKLANENAKVRNDAMLELRQLVESGDVEGAKEYKRKINIALQQMGIAELTIPVTDEERAERAAARRERMLRKRAEQAAAEKLKENSK